MLPLYPDHPFQIQPKTSVWHATRCPASLVFSTSSRRQCNTKSRSWQTARSITCSSRGGSSEVRSFREGASKIPTQGESLVRGMQPSGLQLQEREPPADVDFLSVTKFPFGNMGTLMMSLSDPVQPPFSFAQEARGPI